MKRARRKSAWLWGLALVSTLFAVDCRAGDVSFWVKTYQDTFVVSEPVFVFFCATTSGERAVRRFPLILMQGSFEFDVIDLRSGRSVARHLPSGLNSSASDSMYLSPGDTVCSFDDITAFAKPYDDTLYRHYLWPGSYRAIFGWCCREGCSDSLGYPVYLFDTLDFEVVHPVGLDRDAMAAYRAAETPTTSQSASIQAKWKVVKRYPESPYAGILLDELIPRLPRFVNEPIDDSLTEVLAVRLFVTNFPNHPDVGKYVRRLVLRMDPPDSQSWLDEMVSRVRSGTLAERVLRIIREEVRNDGGG